MEWRYPIEEREFLSIISITIPIPTHVNSKFQSESNEAWQRNKTDQKVFLFLCFCLSLGYRNAAFWTRAKASKSSVKQKSKEKETGELVELRAVHHPPNIRTWQSRRREGAKQHKADWQKGKERVPSPWWWWYYPDASPGEDFVSMIP
jgi:hypothetical protein